LQLAVAHLRDRIHRLQLAVAHLKIHFQPDFFVNKRNTMILQEAQIDISSFQVNGVPNQNGILVNKNY
jgi:hypothetical protein